MKYKNYLNTKNGSNRIYSTDNLLQMTMNDILDAEDALGYQYNTIGLPDDSDLFNSSFVRQTRTPKGTLEWQSILDDGIAPQTNIVNHIVDPQTSNLKTPPFVPQYKQVMNSTPQNFFNTQKSTYELLEEERERQRQQQLQQQQLVQNLGNTPVQTPTSSMPMEDIAPVDLGGTSIDMNLVGDLVNTAVNKYKTRKKKPESKSVLKDAIDTEVNNKPLKQTDLQEAIKTSTTPDVEDPKTTSSIGNAIDEATTLRNDPLWDELTKSLPNATPEGEWDLVEQQRLKNFDKVWNEKNGVQPKGGVMTGSSSGVKEDSPSDILLQGSISKTNLMKGIENKLNAFHNKFKGFIDTGFNKTDDLTLKQEVDDWYQKLINNKTDYSKPITAKEKIVDLILQNRPTTRGHFPIASDMYTDARTDFSRARKNPNAKVLENMNSLPTSIQNVLKEYGVNGNSRGVYYNEQSRASKKFAKSRQLKKFFIDNEEAIKEGKIKEYSFNFGINDSLAKRENADRYASLQHAKLINPYFDEQGNMRGVLIDNYDFEHRNVNGLFDLKNIINNHGYNMQQKGNLENYYSVMDVNSPSNLYYNLLKLIYKKK